MPDWLRWIGTEFVQIDVVGRLLLAALLGSIVGIERERSHKAAGFRTNILICTASALIMEVSREIAESWGPRADPTRMPGQIVSGIGFLGAGTILVTRGRVVLGLTTAATIWAVAGIGIAVGAEAYTHAIVATVLIVFVLSFLGWLEELLFPQVETVPVDLDLAPAEGVVERMTERLRRGRYRIRVVDVEKKEDAVHLVVETTGRGTDRSDLLESLAAEPDVQRVNVPVTTQRPEGAGYGG